MIYDGRAEGPYNDLRTANSIRSIISVVVTGGGGGRHDEKWARETGDGNSTVFPPPRPDIHNTGYNV